VGSDSQPPPQEPHPASALRVSAHHLPSPEKNPAGTHGVFSSVQFAKINVVLSAKALQDHDTVISVIDAVVTRVSVCRRVKWT